MLRSTGLLAAGFACFLLAGGHWAAAQCVAWGKMLAANSARYGTAAGVERTFSGRHPCGMCKKVQSGRQAEDERKPPLAKLEKKGDLGIAQRAAFVPRPAVRFAGVRSVQAGPIEEQPSEPLVPPPRA